MKITVYTITDCTFSQSLKTYLKSKNLTFEEKNLEANKEWLTEMLAISNNFAGTPVTKIEKDDGQIMVIKGFTQEEFDKALGFSGGTNESVAPAPAVAQQPPAPVVSAPQQTPPPVSPVTDPNMPSPVSPVVQPQINMNTPQQAPVGGQAIPPMQPPAAPMNPPQNAAPSMTAEQSQQAIADALQNVEQIQQQNQTIPPVTS